MPGKALLTTKPLVLYNIYYGDFSSTAGARNTTKLMDYFAANIGQSDWYKTLYSYYQDIDGVRTYVSEPAVYAGRSWFYESKSRALTITTKHIEDAILNLINQDLNPLPIDPNGLYVVMFRGDFKFSGWAELEGWCGFHRSIRISNGVTLAYAAVGDPSTAPAATKYNCMALTTRTANNNLAADSMVSTYAHEIADSLTNTFDAWFFANGYEIADQCQWSFGTTTNWNIKVGKRVFLVQQIWMPGFGCTTSVNVPTAAPTFWSKYYEVTPPTFAPAILPTVSPGRSEDVSYHGGPVLTNAINIYNIFIGDFAVETATLMNYFAARIGDTSLFRVLGSYYQLDGSKQSFGPTAATFVGNYSIPASPTELTLTDSVIQDALAQQMAAQHLPIDEDAVYMVLFRGDFDFNLDGQQWPAGFCSYFKAFYLPNAQLIKYSVIGDPSTAGPGGSNCMTGLTSLNGDLGADNMATTYLQSLADSATNYAGAWYNDQTGAGCGLSCQNGDYISLDVGTKQFYVQQLYLPGSGCVSRAVASSPAPSAQATAAPSIAEYLDVRYYNGAVMTQGINLYNIYVGDFASTESLRRLVSIVDHFTTYIGNSSWYEVLSSSYYQIDSTGKKSFVSASAQFIKSVVYALPASSTSLDETGVRTILAALMASNQLPVDASGVYNVIFSGSLQFSSSGLGSWPVDWCSFHGAAVLSNARIKYTISGDPATARNGAGAACQAPLGALSSANEHLGADSIVSEIAAALAGTVTNFDGSGWHFPDLRSDIGDACFQNYGALFDGNYNIVLGSKRFLIQANWVPKYGCKMAL